MKTNKKNCATFQNKAKKKQTKVEKERERRNINRVSYKIEQNVTGFIVGGVMSNLRIDK